MKLALVLAETFAAVAAILWFALAWVRFVVRMNSNSRESRYGFDKRGAELKAEIDESALKTRLAGSCFIRFRHFRNGGCRPELVGLVKMAC